MQGGISHQSMPSWDMQIEVGCFGEWGEVRRGPEGRVVEAHRLSWNPSVVTWLCGPGESFSFSEVLFPHPV